MTKLRAGDRCPCCGQPLDVDAPKLLADTCLSMLDAMDSERAWCLATGSRCTICGRSIIANSPERPAVLQNMPDAMATGSTCGTCPVAMATAHDHLVVCPFAEARDGIGLRNPDSRCTMEVVW